MTRYLVELELDKFLCEADDTQHAIEQAENAYPNQKVWRVNELLVAWERDL